MQSDTQLKGMGAADYDLLVIPDPTTCVRMKTRSAWYRSFVTPAPGAAICPLAADRCWRGARQGADIVRLDLANAGASWLDAEVQVCPG